jgi:hypothetical protein
MCIAVRLKSKIGSYSHIASDHSAVSATVKGNSRFLDYCEGLFVDSASYLYCSSPLSHRVIKTSLNQPNNQTIIVAGTGCSGSAANMLSSPQGIFVTVNLDLYVADCGNNRVQRFDYGQLDAITVAGSGANGTITLQCPMSVIMDADGYLFISDRRNHRVVGSSELGFRCIVGCSGTSNFTSSHLSYPSAISFDSLGNLYVVDSGNNRIQKFSIVSSVCSRCVANLRLVTFVFLRDSTQTTTNTSTGCK